MIVVAGAVAAVLFLGMAAFQGALALGAPLGAHVLGGRNVGKLPGRLRAASAVALVILVAAAIIVLARSGVIASPAVAAGLLAPACWVIRVHGAEYAGQPPVDQSIRTVILWRRDAGPRDPLRVHRLGLRPTNRAHAR